MSKSAETKKYMPLVGAADGMDHARIRYHHRTVRPITVWQLRDLTYRWTGRNPLRSTYICNRRRITACRNITKLFGLICSFNLMNLMYLIGAAICVLSGNFPALLAGLIITGFASGADLPISLTVISHDAPNEKVSASLIASTQVFWQIVYLDLTQWHLSYLT